MLVSQVVTQRDVHKENARAFLDELGQARASADRVVAILGGPRIDHRLALELGYDAGFGPGTKPSDVANYIVGAVLARAGKAPTEDARWLTGVLIRMRMSQADAHYGGNLVDGARMLALFGDVATELLVRHDGDEGLFRAYDAVEFLAPVHAGDYVEADGRDHPGRRDLAGHALRGPQGDRAAPRPLRQRRRGARRAGGGLPGQRDLRGAEGQAAPACAA